LHPPERPPEHPPERRRLAQALSAAALAGAGLVAHAQPPGDVAAAASPATVLTREQVDEQAQNLRQLPGLTGSRTQRSLRLKPDDRPPPEPDATPDWMHWLQDFAAWFNDAGRWLVWGLMALALAVLLLRLRSLARLLGLRAETLTEPLALPTQVRGLDISPESLPDDVGAAAWVLWQAGQPLAAMSLLYRGALSKLVHLHQVPIRSSSTEGDCLALAAPHLQAPARQYLVQLVGSWRQAAYAARWPADPDVQQLCQRFRALDARPASGAAP
jgi:hypothetical protein